MKTVAVICKDVLDFKKWKVEFIDHGDIPPHQLTYDSQRAFQYKDTRYISICKTIELCSQAIDQIICTSYAHTNPYYNDILSAAESNLKEQKPDVNMEELKTIKQMKVSDAKYVGVMKAKDWFQGEGLSFIFPNDFVVCEWCDYHDGVNSHIEGKTTIGILKTIEDAEIIYNNRSLQPSQKFPTSAEIHQMADHYKNLEGPNRPDGSIYVYAGIEMVKHWLYEHGLL